VNRSDGDGMWFMLGIFLVSLVVLFYVFPILLLITARDVVGWGWPIALMSIPVALFFDGQGWLDHPFVLALHSVYWGAITLLIFSELFVRDAHLALALFVSFPLCFVLYFVVLEPVTRGMGEVGKTVVRKVVATVAAILGVIIAEMILFVIRGHW
jgi:hypothetical protein